MKKDQWIPIRIRVQIIGIYNGNSNGMECNRQHRRYNKPTLYYIIATDRTVGGQDRMSITRFNDTI